MLPSAQSARHSRTRGHRPRRVVLSAVHPPLEVIAAHVGVPTDALRRLPEGTNVVFLAGDAIVKVYPPRWAGLARAELAVLGVVAGRLPVETPRVLGSGVIDEWPYVLMTRLRGRPLHDVRPELDDAQWQRVVADVGELLAAIHTLPRSDLADAMEADWPRLVRERGAGCVARHREQGAPAHLIEQMPAFLDGAAPLYPAHFQPVIVTGDLHDYHLLVDGHHLVGLFDFDDARLGYAEYDLAATGLFLAAGKPHLLRTLVEAYGQRLDRGLPVRLMAYTLLHRYRSLRWVLDEFVGRTPDTLDELAQAIYRVSD